MDRPVRRAAGGVLALELVLAACSPGARAGVRLQIFGDAAEIAAYRALIAAYERREPGAAIELVAVPDQSDHVAKLSTAFSGDDPPDLFLINFRRFGQFAARDVLEPLGDRLDRSSTLGRDDLYEQALDAFTSDGDLACLPQNISSLVVYYNRALFQRFGVPTPEPDWDWDDFLRTARALTNDTDSDGTADVYGVGTDPLFIRLAPFVWQAGGEVVDDLERPTRTALLDDAAIRAMTFFIDLRRRHRVSPTLEEAASRDYEDRFADGTLGMLLDSRRATTALRAVPGLDFDVAPLPRDRERATILHSDAYCMARASKHKDAAFRFIEFAVGTEGSAIIARTGRTVPSLRAVAESEAFLDPNQRPRHARVFLDAIPFIRRTPTIATWNEIETKADVRVEEWYFGQEAPEALGIEIDLDTRELFTEAGG